MRLRPFRVFAICLLAAALSVPSARASAQGPSADRQLTVLYSADERGEITPCG